MSNCLVLLTLLLSDPVDSLTPEQIHTHVYREYQSRMDNSDEMYYPALEASKAFRDAKKGGRLSIEHRRAVLRQLQHAITDAGKKLQEEESVRKSPANRISELTERLSDKNYTDRFLREEIVKQVWELERDRLGVVASLISGWLIEVKSNDPDLED